MVCSLDWALCKQHVGTWSKCMVSVVVLENTGTKTSLVLSIRALSVSSIFLNKLITIFILHHFNWQTLMNVIPIHVKTVVSVETWWILTLAIVPIQVSVGVTVKSVSYQIHPQYCENSFDKLVNFYWYSQFAFKLL